MRDTTRDEAVVVFPCPKVPLMTNFKTKETKNLANLLRSGQVNPGPVLICWHHGDIPELLLAFNVDPKKLLPHGEWPDGVFGWMIEIQIGRKAVPASHIVNEFLMPGDREDALPGQAAR